jgi:hypothetical protein
VAEEREEEQQTEVSLVGPEGPLPRNWAEAIPFVTWGFIALGFALESVNALTHAEWLRSAISFAGLLVVMVAMIHWRQARGWISRTHPNLGFLGAALLLMVITLTPFIEQRRWPFAIQLAALLTHSNNNEKIVSLTTKLSLADKEAKALQQKLDNAERDLGSARAELDKTKKELEYAKANTAPDAISMFTHRQLLLSPTLPTLGTNEPSPISWVRLYYNSASNSLATMSKDDNIAEITIQQEKGSISNALLKVFYVSVRFRDEIGPFTVSMQKERPYYDSFAGVGGVAQGFIYTIGDNGSSIVRMTLDFADKYNNYLILTPSDINLYFFKKG